MESVEEARLVAVVSTSPEWHLTGHTDHRWKGEEKEKRGRWDKGKRDKGRKTMVAEPGIGKKKESSQFQTVREKGGGDSRIASEKGDFG